MNVKGCHNTNRNLEGSYRDHECTEILIEEFQLLEHGMGSFLTILHYLNLCSLKPGTYDLDQQYQTDRGKLFGNAS